MNNMVLNFWEKVVPKVLYKIMTYDFTESKLERLKKEKFDDFVAYLNELSIIGRNFNNDISEYISEFLEQEIILDKVLIESLSKLIKNKFDVKNEKTLVSYLFAIVSNEHQKDSLLLFSKKDDEITKFITNQTMKIKERIKRKFSKKDYNKFSEFNKEAEKYATQSAKDRYERDRIPKDEISKNIDLYVSYMVASEVFKLIQTDNILISLPLKSLLYDMQSYVELDDLADLRMRKTILESEHSITKKLEITSIPDYIFSKVHSWLRTQLSDRQYRERLDEDNLSLFRSKLSINFEIYNNILRKAINLTKYV